MNKTFLRRGRVLLASTITALLLAACGGAGGDSPSANLPASVTQAGVIVPRSMGGTAIVGQEYKGQIEVAPSDASVTVASLSIVNNVASGAQPSIDAAGNITWTPNDQDFTGIASLRVTGNLSNGTVISDNIPMDVRKVRVVVQKALIDSEKIYSDDEGRYLINVTRKTATSVISGELIITEKYRSNGEFSWTVETSGDEFFSTILQAPATQFTSLKNSLNISAKQVGVVQLGLANASAYPVSRIAVGYGDFSDLREGGSVFGHYGGGNNVYTSRQPEYVYYDVKGDAVSNNVRHFKESLTPMDVFWFGSNCASGSISAADGGAPECVSRAQTKAPIILIHGFSGGDNAGIAEAIKGGGPATWGQTANLLTDEGHPVFEMRWLSYMSFEDAAGALAKFGKDIAIITGKKPIILAHSFGGIVSHIALQNKGREWKSDVYGVGNWHTVNTDGVFEKLLTLNSPLSGINADSSVAFNPMKKIYNDVGGLSDVAFPRGVDMDDKSIKLCYSLTCAQAGAVFNSNQGFYDLAANKAVIDGYTPLLERGSYKILSGVITSLKEGESIADIQTGLIQSKNNAPFTTVVGFRNFLGHDVRRTNTDFSYYKLGDGLISLLGQSAIPQDFSNSAFDVNGTALFKFKFEDLNHKKLKGLAGTLEFTEKGDCIKYSKDIRNYLICPYSAHTLGKVPGVGTFSPLDENPAFSNDFNGTGKTVIDTLGPFNLIHSYDSTAEFAIANYDGSTTKHAMWNLVNSKDYINTTSANSSFAKNATIKSTINGRLGASAAPKQVGLVGSASLTPVKFAVIWATVIEKSTGVSKHYFSGAQSDDAGQFNIDIGSVISNKFGSAAVLADYRIKLKIDVVGYKSWSQNIETLDATVDLGDIDLALTTSNVHSISPAIARVGTTTTFTIIGTNLPATAHLDITFNGCANIQFVSQSAAQHQFTCTPTAAGTLTAVIRTLPGTTPLGSFPVAVSTAPLLCTLPQVPSNGACVTPTNVTVDIPATDFINGLNVALSANGYGVDTLMNAPPYGSVPNGAQWLITVPAGRYKLFATYASGLARPVAISINGTTVFANALASVTGGFLPTNRQTFLQGTVELPTNASIMTVSRGDSFPHIQGFTLVPVSALEGSFQVNANDTAGTTFIPPNGVRTCTFNATGYWTNNGVTSNANGDPTFTPAVVLYLQSANFFSLIASSAEAGFQFVGTNSMIPVAPGQTFLFTANEVVSLSNVYYDNSGSMSVSYTCSG